MPKTYKRRNNKRRNYKRRPKSKYLKGGSGVVKATKTLAFPDKLVVKMPWIGANAINNPTLSASILKQYRLNSVWDPDTAVGAGQISAKGYQQYSAIYNRYRVLGVKVIADLNNPNTNVPVKAIMYATNDASMDYGAFSCQLQPHIKEVAIPPLNGGNSCKRMVKYFSLARVNGVSDTTYRADDRYQSTIGNNPSEYIGLNLHGVPMGNNAGGVDFGLLVNMKIIYYVEWFDLKQGIGLSEPPVELQEEGTEHN